MLFLMSELKVCFSQDRSVFFKIYNEYFVADICMSDSINMQKNI